MTLETNISVTDVLVQNVRVLQRWLQFTLTCGLVTSCSCTGCHDWQEVLIQKLHEGPVPLQCLQAVAHIILCIKREYFLEWIGDHSLINSPLINLCFHICVHVYIADFEPHFNYLITI